MAAIYASLVSEKNMRGTMHDNDLCMEEMTFNKE